MRAHDAKPEISLVLDALERGDAAASSRLFPLIYDELKRRAARLMAGERRDHTLQRTALVNEAYLRIVQPGASYTCRLHFFNAAALAMRRILIDHAAARGAAKRGGGRERVAIDGVDAADLAEPGHAVDVIALDDALTELARLSPRQAEVVHLRFFAGLGDGEIAELLGVSDKTVRRDWACAKIWLYDRIRD
jgi:RNA polymerase sigma factor (TIGR02999 family)